MIPQLRKNCAVFSGARRRKQPVSPEILQLRKNCTQMKTPLAPVFLVLLTTGCTLLPVGGHPSSARAGKLSPMGHGLMEYRAAFHVHCFLSHDSRGTIEEIASAASRLGLDAVI